MQGWDKNLNQVMQELKKVIIGKDKIIEKVLMAILAGGHVLIEDIPGVGKTTLALAISKVLQLDYRRMQFTPDVLPSDVVGFQMLSPDGQMQYRPGSIMCNLFLADEINRTSSKTQSALLEVMEEGNVTVDGVTRPLPKPFVVIATQNPIGSVGTQMLPESQMDRFMVRLTMGYPDIASEIGMLKDREGGNPLERVENVLSRRDLLQIREMVENTYIHDAVYEYIAALVQRTRDNDMLSLGVSPRGTIALANMSKAAAYLSGRDYVIPDDVKKVFCDVTKHRMLLAPKARLNRTTMDDVARGILTSVNAPRLHKK